MTRLAAALALLLTASTAEATRFRRPFNVDRGLTASFDDARGAGQRDYACGTYTYDDHTGSDFGVYFTDIVAVADATVIATFDGCADYGSITNTCGQRCGNQVRLRLDDGNVALYCHLKRGSIAVGVGQRVSCGQRLATSASSGSSTGPHLHLTWLRGGVLSDNYAGNCSNSPGVWTLQRGYLQAPGTDCEVKCECSPGQMQAFGCGRCGVARRWCGSNCHWGGWSGCEGEGPCWPGQVEDVSCCDCGRTRRSCNGACQWDGWSACAGPDPAGNPTCATGRPGVCAEGRRRCVGGCLTCAELVSPSPEVCDDRDNDCDGTTDEDASQLGSTPPAYGAALVDASYARTLSAGTRDEAWVVFRNVGRATWHARDVWLRSDAAAQGSESALEVPLGWAAWDVPAVLDHDVAPGELATFTFPVHAPDDARADVSESFSLVAAGVPVACPEPTLPLAVAVLGAAPRVDAADAGNAANSAPSGCTHTGAPVSAIMVAAIALSRRRRR